MNDTAREWMTQPENEWHSQRINGTAREWMAQPETDTWQGASEAWGFRCPLLAGRGWFAWSQGVWAGSFLGVDWSSGNNINKCSGNFAGCEQNDWCFIYFLIFFVFWFFFVVFFFSGGWIPCSRKGTNDAWKRLTCTTFFHRIPPKYSATSWKGQNFEMKNFQFLVDTKMLLQDYLCPQEPQTLLDFAQQFRQTAPILERRKKPPPPTHQIRNGEEKVFPYHIVHSPTFLPTTCPQFRSILGLHASGNSSFFCSIPGRPHSRKRRHNILTEEKISICRNWEIQKERQKNGKRPSLGKAAFQTFGPDMILPGVFLFVEVGKLMSHKLTSLQSQLCWTKACVKKFSCALHTKTNLKCR